MKTLAREDTMNTKGSIKIFALVLVLVMCAAVLAACANTNAARYREAFDLLEQKDYEAAYALFTELGDYKDAAKEVAKFHYVPTSYTAEYTDSEGTTIETNTVSYNENNLISQCVLTYENGDTHTCSCTYNENGKLTKVVCSDADGSRTYYECVYNANGDVVKEAHHYYDGYFVTYENFYDENGQRVKVVVEDDTGKEVYDVVHNEKGKIARFSLKDENGEEARAEEYLYDEDGRLIKMNYINSGEITGFMTYEYNENGDMIKERMGDETDYFSIREYTYDANGKLAKIYSDFSYGAEDVVEITSELVYVPFEYSAEDWQSLMNIVLAW